MRSIFVALATVCLSAQIATAQKVNVPPMAKEAFAKKYPGATNVKWEKEKGWHEASFKYDGHSMSVVYTSAGEVVETETVIPVAELPKTAREYASAKGPIKEAAKIVKADGTVVYEAEVKHKDLLFDEKGTYISPKEGK